MDGARDPLTVFYDGSCGLCLATVSWALARDRDRALQPLPFQDEAAQRMLGPHSARAAEELHVWSQREGLRAGADAIAAMLDRLPGWRWAGALLAWPPVRVIARPVYRWVAAHRAGWRSCSVPVKRPT